MKIASKIIISSLLAISCSIVCASEAAKDGDTLFLKAGRAVEVETPFAEPGVIAGKEFDVKITGQFVRIALNPNSHQNSGGRIYFFDKASKPVGQMNALMLNANIYTIGDDPPSTIKLTQ